MTVTPENQKEASMVLEGFLCHGMYPFSPSNPSLQIPEEDDPSWFFWDVLSIFRFLGLRLSQKLHQVTFYYHLISFLCSFWTLEWKTQPIVNKFNQDSKPAACWSIFHRNTLYSLDIKGYTTLNWISQKRWCILQTHDSTRKFTSLSNSWSIKQKDLWE